MGKSRPNIRRITGTVLFPLLLAAGIFPRCANQAAPQGGPSDSLPPVVVSMDPAFGKTNFTGKKIYIEFDEYVKLNDLQKEFFTSPFMKKKPMVTLRGRGIQIDIQDTLATDQTYALNFGTSIQDNNEGNPLGGFRYVFSTGDKVDSLVMSGYTGDGYTGDSLSKSFIMFYAAAKDSVPDRDSTLYKAKPDAVGRAENNGIFITENLKPMDYRIYAMQDNNNNQTYEPGTDLVGFLDTVYNPANMPPFNIWYDTLRKYLVADPQIYFRMFKEEKVKRQLFSGANRTGQYKIVMSFGAPYPTIEKLEFSNIDTTKLIREYLKPTRDSIAYWLNIAPENLPDTIKGEITFLMHDSLNNLVPETKELKLGWKKVESKAQERERLKKEEEREKAIAAGEEVEPEKNPFNVKVEGGTNVNPERNISFTFDYPLIKLDSAAISLIRQGDGEQKFAVKTVMRQDTLNIRKWTLSAAWQEGGKYQMVIPAGAFADIAGQSNDTLRSDFNVMSPDKYATIVMHVKGKTPESKYVLQLMNGTSVKDEIRNASTGDYTFRFVDPGAVSIRILEDENDNGVWDTGNIIERRHSERMEVYTAENGDREITTKANWELEIDIDMNAVFAPVTMESLSKKLRTAEAARVRKLLQDKEKQQQQNRNMGRVQEQAEGNNGRQGNIGNQQGGNMGNMNRSGMGQGGNMRMPFQR